MHAEQRERRADVDVDVAAAADVAADDDEEEFDDGDSEGRIPKCRRTSAARSLARGTLKEEPLF